MSRWKILKNKESIIWEDKFDAHQDYLEMSGLQASFIVHYGVDEVGQLFLSRHVVYPGMRTRPNDTHASYQCDILEQKMPHLYVDGSNAEIPIRFIIDGNLHTVSLCEGAEIRRVFFPSIDKRACFERIVIKNISNHPVHVNMDRSGVIENDTIKGCMAINITDILVPHVEKTIDVGESFGFVIIYLGRTANEQIGVFNADEEELARVNRIKELKKPLSLDTGGILDTMFEFSKIRAGESVFETRNGIIHCPGGGSYYAAVWCNDQAEYSGPWFAFTGDKTLLKAADNAYKWFIPFMGSSYDKIPSSIIAEGVDYWDGAGDRGDAAMYLYGASFYSLICGDKEVAAELWDSIKWCAEYCNRKINEYGVVMSDSDELEGRFPSGNANLCTSCLYYMGLKAAACLAREFDDSTRFHKYNTQADTLKQAIETYFGAEVSGYNTYRYYDGNDLLRSWICMPLCAGIFDRAADTVNALLGKELFTKDGLLSQENTQTVWDRSTLYALRGIFKAGYPEKAFQFLQEYCTTRLLGERVPYAIEAYPEGNKRHLSAESALFAQIVLFGILGIVPTGFCTFELNPVLPKAMDHLYLKDIYAFGQHFHIYVEKDKWTVSWDNKEICGTGRAIIDFNCGGEL